MWRPRAQQAKANQAIFQQSVPSSSYLHHSPFTAIGSPLQGRSFKSMDMRHPRKSTQPTTTSQNFTPNFQPTWSARLHTKQSDATI